MMTSTWLLSRVDGLSDILGLSAVPRKAMRRMVQNPSGFFVVTRNLGQAFKKDNTAIERSVHVACALSRTNGLLWTVFFILVFMALYLACCWPCTNMCALCFRFVRDRPRERERPEGSDVL